MTSLPISPSHYPTPAAKYADLAIHLVGLTLALVGGAVMLHLSLGSSIGKVAAIAIYAGGLVAMLACSLAYNFSVGRIKPLLRRLDHAGIFLMIAGTYTPFTTLALAGVWAWGMTIAVWTIACLGILGKLLLPNLADSLWIAVYLALGWIVVIAAGPVAQALCAPALVLLVIGGLVYTLGVVFHVKEDLKFSRSIWHGHVVAAAGVHWAAVLIGTVL